MLAAPAKSSTTTTNDNKQQPSNLTTSDTFDTFDTFDSPFYTPSLFSTSYKLFNTESSSPPESFFNVMVDLESTGTRTPSPNNDFYCDEHIFKVEQQQPPFLYNQQQQHNYQYQRKAEHITTTNYPIVDGLFTVDKLSNQQQQLNESMGTVQNLLLQLQMMKNELDKKHVMFMNSQSSLAVKETEYLDCEQKLSIATQYIETQAKQINFMQSEIIMYQSFIKSKGLELPNISGEIVPAIITTTTATTGMESSENKYNNRLCKLRDYPETSKSMETTTTIRNSDTDIYYNTGRRWSEERVLCSNDTIIERKNSASNNSLIDYNRMLMDKNVNVNWDSLVDRIIKETDQKASIFLQNKFKCSTIEQKQLIFESILKKSFELMTNRFGNFLVQRLLELGTNDQILSLIETMKGHILELTCEPFGCHVVQKALDNVNESIRATLVSELFICIPETITHKYACHVWQKVFEIKWESNTPPPIMKHVHQSLEGKWSQIALDETGSLVIQNIFENLTENDKRPVINEVLSSTVTIAKGQWGNWVIQHILEHAEKNSDRERAFQIVIEEGVQLSTDQFASKVVEKALRIGGEQFMNKFIKKISTNNTHNRPRVALIDIASDQYGNYVVQWLINNSSEDQRVFICRLIKRHMVSLRSSKYGQRVAFLVEKVLRNNEITTYPSSSSSTISMKHF